MAATVQISGRLLAKNWALNLLGWVVPLLVALAAIPYVIHGLGTERFGILSIASALLVSFGLVDMGLGRATTRFVAECLARGEMEKLPGIVWTSLWSQMIFGVIAGVLAFALIPVLVSRFLHISPGLEDETRNSFFILAASLPVLLALNSLRGVLEAGQHFNVVNYVKVPTSISMFLLPALAVPLKLHLPGIVYALVVARLAATAAYLWACLKFFPVLRHRFSSDSRLLRPMLVYGGWVTITNFVTPLLTYIDRFFIGSLISMTAVGYYTAPYEAISRAWVIPGTLAQTLFPAFANLEAGGSSDRLEELCARSLKSLLLLSGPALLLVVIFARQILGLWLGSAFADASASVLQILALGTLVQSLALVPFSLLQGIGRADLTAKFNLLELPFYAIACWVLVRLMGLPGAALAWALRMTVDAVLLFGAAVWLKCISLRTLRGKGLQRTVLIVSVFAAFAILLWLAGWSLFVQVLLAAVLLSVFAIVAWSYVLDARDRSLLGLVAIQVRGLLARSK
ncbi:MAG TPA: flippase [Candidatus Angelobacter sp.]|nr:flippase [Candidatus Angelobacter sp.]